MDGWAVNRDLIPADVHWYDGDGLALLAVWAEADARDREIDRVFREREQGSDLWGHGENVEFGEAV